MSYTVTPADVNVIYPNTADTALIQACIDGAHLIVTEDLSSSGMSDARLKLVETYLAAHLAVISIEKGGITRRKIGESEDYYQLWTNTAVGLMSTRFGQQAAMYDTSGKLAAAANGKQKAQFTVVGNNPADETGYC